MPDQIEQAERLADIMAQVGFALWQLQELEGSAAQYFVLLTQATQGMGRTPGEALVEQAQSKTFGATIRQLAKAGLLDDELSSRFNALLDERNWLVHRSKADSRDAVHNKDSARQFVHRLEAIGDETDALLKKIVGMAQRFVTERGVPTQEIARATRQLLQQWQSGDAY
ncbi:hypothetical protein [Paraburkholderia sediminicola]|uniref:hypothetical protein n=1 Tax=Paraburkholderia sediminicola TaxID=458836 RepID=UPI0038B991ED